MKRWSSGGPRGRVAEGRPLWATGKLGDWLVGVCLLAGWPPGVLVAGRGCGGPEPGVEA